MNIQQIAETIIRGEKAIDFPLINHGGWIADQKGNHILDVRGWGFLQYADGNIGGILQDGIGDWVVRTLNKAFLES